MERTRGFGNTNPGGGKEKSKRPDEIVDLVRLGKDYTQLRLLGPVYSYAQHWIDIETPKGVISIPKVSLNYDMNTDSYDSTIEDPYLDIENPRRTTKRYFVNAIVRDLQDDEPRKKPEPTPKEKKKKLKEKGSKTWTPVQVLSIPEGVAGDLKKLMQMNKHRIEGKVVECELTDPKYGCDIFISFDGDAPGAKKYNVQKGDKNKLTLEEKKYLLWDLSNMMTPEDIKEARKEAKALASKSPQDESVEDEDEDEDDDALSRRRRKKKTGSSTRTGKSSSRERSSKSSSRTKTGSKVRDKKRTRKSL